MQDDEPSEVAPQRSPGERERVGKSRDPTARERIWAALPFVVSIAAVLISLLAFIDQHNANRAAENSVQRAYATQASYLLVYQPEVVPSFGKSGKHLTRALRALLHDLTKFNATLQIQGGQVGPGDQATVNLIVPRTVQVVIENQGNAPISDVNLIVDGRDVKGRLLGSVTIGIGTVPPCSTATVHVFQRAAGALVTRLLQEKVSGIVPTMEARGMIFTDGLGVRWMRSQNGTLAKYSGHLINMSSSIETPTINHITAAPGC